MESQQKFTMAKRAQVLKDRDVVITMLRNDLGVDLLSKSRRQLVVEARAAFAYAFYERGYSLKDIGHALNKDHSTIIHLKNKFDSEASQSQRMQVIYNHISKKISDRGPAKQNQTEMEALIKENERLRKQLSSDANQDIRFKEIFDIIRERTPAGAEDEVKKRLYWMLNTINEQLKRT